MGRGGASWCSRGRLFLFECMLFINRRPFFIYLYVLRPSSGMFVFIVLVIIIVILVLLRGLRLSCRIRIRTRMRSRLFVVSLIVAPGWRPRGGSRFKGEFGRSMELMMLWSWCRAVMALWGMVAGAGNGGRVGGGRGGCGGRGQNFGGFSGLFPLGPPWVPFPKGPVGEIFFLSGAKPRWPLQGAFKAPCPSTRPGGLRLASRAGGSKHSPGRSKGTRRKN